MKYSSAEIVKLIEDLIEYSIKCGLDPVYYEDQRIARQRLITFFDEVLLRK